ncbi:MAG TPA: DEAD/DEAH box helicase, partial [Egibacteraceae bacterium]|nr:DEAD/DEAH box helicase [Egibacteraceae bacterium]
MPGDPLQHFSAPTQAWFRSAFAAPTDAQARAWESLATGASTLVSAPTGSGKTLAAFLVAIDRLLTAPPPAKGAGSRVLYVSPLKALVYDVDRNLRAPLAGIAREAGLLGAPLSPVTVGMRTGDTSSQERQRMARRPPDILVTTPESLFLLLTSAAREMLAGVETVILDEVHAVAATKRGAHLALCIERLEELAAARGGPGLQRIGLSATQRPLEEVGRFLAGGAAGADGAWAPRPVRIVESASEKSLDLEIIVPVEDMSRLGETIEVPPTGPVSIGDQSRRSIWPAVHPRILDLVMAHRSTIVFVNSRRLAERLCARLNELAQEAAEEDAQSPDDGPAPILARAHHGSVAREQRLGIEEDLKAGRLRCVVATSSLELGIDMGAVDLVIQVESPGSVASGVQRIGRAGHQVGAPSVGKIFPKYRGDLVECAVVVRRMLRSEIEETRILRNPLDVLAQQIVAMAAMDAWDVNRLHALVRRAAGFADLSRAQLDGVLDMLSGRYPSDEFAELRPRLNWDRVADRITGRPGAQRLAVTSGGTIPDRGLYGVFIAGEGPSRGEGGRVAAAGGRGSRRVGELDEEMVYETRPGETFTLGSSTWRVEDITRDQVLVTPAPGQPGKMPFWHGDGPGRPIEVGRAVGAFVREIGDLPADEAITRLAGEYGLDDLAAVNLVAYLADQREATGSLPSDRSLVIERFRDEIGDWRVVVLSPFGGPVHAPWALAIEAQARERLGLDVQTMHADDGIVVRVPEADEAPPADLVLVDPERVQDLVISRLGGSALFAARFRECAARALLLPRRRPGGRTPLWQQRQRAADLLAVASRYPSFPITLETYRECLRDVFDVPALIEILSGVASRRIRTVQVETPVASPFASSLLFDYIAGYMYDGDTPLAERRAHALSLDRELLAELLGSDELRELIDPDALDAVEAEAQRLAPDRLARGIDGVHDLLRQLGDLRADEVRARCEGDSGPLLDALESARRAYRLRIAGEERWVAVEDAARFRDALGLPPPPGMPDAFLEPVERPMIDLVARYARTHGPFEAWEVAERLALPRDAVELSLKELEREGRVLAGAFRPAGTRSEWCDAEILRRLRRRSLAALRREVEPVGADALVRFLPAWQGVGDRATGVDRALEAVEQLSAAPIPASVLERDVLSARVRDYSPSWLDELCASGEVVWIGRGPLGPGDGRISLYLRDQVALLAPALATAEALEAEPWWSARHAGLLAELSSRGASFWPQLHAAAGGGDEAEAVDALWDLVWAGVVTNDPVQPLRAAAGGADSRARRRAGRGR